MPGESITQSPREFLIYLVDDEEMLLNLAEVILSQEGYTLKKFLSAEAALEAFLNEPQKPALLLTDFSMLPMNGLELSAKCRSAHPTLKIVLVSGTAGEEVMHASMVSIDDFVTKPYQPAELARAVRALLRA